MENNIDLTKWPSNFGVLPRLAFKNRPVIFEVFLNIGPYDSEGFQNISR